MESATVSMKYQVVIPKKVREELGIQPGQKVHVIPYQGRIELVPLETMEEGKGFLEGLDTDIELEPDRL